MTVEESCFSYFYFTTSICYYKVVDEEDDLFLLLDRYHGILIFFGFYILETYELCKEIKHTDPMHC